MPTNPSHQRSSVAEELIAFTQLFSSQVALTPEAIAVIHEDRRFTYTQLDGMADRIADRLSRCGVKPQAYVGLCADRSAEAIAAMLGIMKAGAAFVPLDPEFPVDRLTYMIDDAQIDTIVAQPNCRELLLESCGAVRHWVDLRSDLVDEPVVKFEAIDIPADSLAYLMYTSGSTGKPKGVQIDHAALAAYCFADIDVYEVVPEDRTLQFSTLNFDIAIEEIFPPLLTGSCVVVRPRERSVDANELSALIHRDDVTAVHIATAYWHEWVDLMVASKARVPDSIRLMVVTGEKVSVEHYKRWLTLCDRDVLWCNAYGPTEATVSSTVFIPNDGPLAPNMPIGKPLKRYDAFILNEDLQPVSDDETGVLYIGGPALARGYLNRPELTDEVFKHIEIDGETRRLYKTGDLARWLPSGDIDFGGRVDHQIKLGSYRIEPGEIEAVVDQHPLLLESLVSYDSVNNKKYLIAYCATGENVVDALSVAAFLRDRLPPYMIPARYVFVDKFPKTTNGKINRRALPPADQSVVPRSAGCVAPRTELERKLAQIWEDVLNVPEIGVHDDFFLLGGSSLLVTRIVAELARDFDVELPVRDFFANPTIASSAKHLANILGMESQIVDEDDAAAQLRRLPRATPRYFQGDSASLFGVHYQPPEICSDTKRHAVLICHSYGHEYTRAYRNLQQLSVQLAQNGFDVFRFDYAGTGNSSGNSTEATFGRMVANAERAAIELRSLTNVDALSVIGVRLGATIAANADFSDLQHRIDWDPIESGCHFIENAQQFHDRAMTSMTRFNRRRKSAVNQIFGHEFTTEQRESICDAVLDRPNRAATSSQWTILSKDTSSSLLDSLGHPISPDVIQTSDEIYWDRPEFTESAFASPDFYAQVTTILDGTLV